MNSINWQFKVKLLKCTTPIIQEKLQEPRFCVLVVAVYAPLTADMLEPRTSPSTPSFHTHTLIHRPHTSLDISHLFIHSRSSSTPHSLLSLLWVPQARLRSIGSGQDINPRDRSPPHWAIKTPWTWKSTTVIHQHYPIPSAFMKHLHSLCCGLVLASESVFSGAAWIVWALNSKERNCRRTMFTYSHLARCFMMGVHLSTNTFRCC